MLKNRSLQVKMVKDADTPIETVEDIVGFEEKVAIIGHQIKGILLMVGGGVIVYIAADTLRQVAIEQVKK